ncbi:MAG: CocE/NonD family hydrolase [Promethearchaeota archaeon]
MKNKDHVTDFKYLGIDLKRSPNIPRSLDPVLNYVFPPILRILGFALGYGIKSNPTVRLPEVMMELRDGTKLATDIYLPKKVVKNKGKCPTILVRLPYWKDNFSFLGVAYAAFGYACVIQDIRGTGHSEGMQFILIPERQDGLECLKWITKQFWYNGKIGMAGGSYFGMTQWCISWENEGLLTTICPAITSFTNMMRMHGGFNIHALLTDFKRILINTTVFRDSPSRDLITTEQYENYVNPRTALYNDKVGENKPKLSHFEGLPVDVIVKFIKRMFKLKEMNLTKRNYKYFFALLERLLANIDINHEKMFGMLELDVSKIEQPAFMLAGWYDLFMEHTLRDYLDIKANGTGNAKKYTRIEIGPWGHADVGGKTNWMTNGIIHFLKSFINKEWYDYWLKGKKYDLIDKPPIKYFVMGRNIWRYSHIWPPKEINYKNLYIHSKGKANSLKGDGTLNFEEPNEEPEDNYKFDPLNPVITKGGRNLDILIGTYDQKDAEMREDVLIYTSDLLEEGIEITGPIKVVLYASTSGKDTDFMVKLVDVYPKGKALNILDGGIRARFRKGEDTMELIEPGKIYKYEFTLGNTSQFFAPDHRIRIEITSSSFPQFDINSNLGGDGEEGDFMIADQKIFHDKEHPTHLVIPIYK